MRVLLVALSWIETKTLRLTFLDWGYNLWALPYKLLPSGVGSSHRSGQLDPGKIRLRRNQTRGQAICIKHDYSFQGKLLPL